MPRVIAGAAAIALLLAPLATAGAQDWPSRAVTMVVPYAAGGPVDTLGRILAARLSDFLGQQVVVENVAGAADPHRQRLCGFARVLRRIRRGLGREGPGKPPQPFYARNSIRHRPARRLFHHYHRR